MPFRGKWDGAFVKGRPPTDRANLVLVIAGKDDAFTPRWMSEETAANIPGSDLHLYDNAGHAFHWECMNDFNPRTTEWLLKH